MTQGQKELNELAENKPFGEAPLDSRYSYLDIEPIRAVITNTKDSVRLGITTVGGKLNYLGVGVNTPGFQEFHFVLLTAKNEVALDGNFKIDGDDYQLWGEDDFHVVECLQKLIPAIKVIKEAPEAE